MPASALLLAHFQTALEIERDALNRFLDRAASNPEQNRAIETTIRTLNDALDRGGKIVVTGIGKSGKVAQKIAATLSSTGSLAIFLHPTEGLHGDIGLVSKQDAVLALSYTGNTEELVRLLPSLKQRQVPILAIVGNLRSKLAEEALAAIDASVEKEACPINLAPTSSTTLALAIGDALAVALMKHRNFDAQAFARNHPAGGIGKKLTLTVKEVMHSGNAVAHVPPTASMEEVIRASTEKKLGGVLVVEGERLAGIITDGDIRRALSHREKFFNMKAHEVMTRKPSTITPETLAHEALRMMEDRPSQISVLPVVDDRGRVKGLVRLHDLVRTL